MPLLDLACLLLLCNLVAVSGTWGGVKVQQDEWDTLLGEYDGLGEDMERDGATSGKLKECRVYPDALSRRDSPSPDRDRIKGMVFMHNFCLGHISGEGGECSEQTA